MNTSIFPELNEKTNAEIEFKVSAIGGYYVTTDIFFKGRGITQLGNGTDHKRAKKTYNMTEKAFAKAKEGLTTCYIDSL